VELRDFRGGNGLKKGGDEGPPKMGKGGRGGEAPFRIQ